MQTLQKHLGTLLILLSLLGFSLLLYPILTMYFFQPHLAVSSNPSEQFTLIIPKINAQAPVIPNVDPWNQDSYNDALKHGVAHAKGTYLPGSGKTVYLFAHSSGMPWEQIYFNTIFLRLGELQEGDTILLDLHQKRYTYRVTMKKEVWPSETRYLEDSGQNQLILQTCTPIGTTFKRLLVFAEPIS